MYVLVHDESEPSASLQNAADLLRQMKVSYLTIAFSIYQAWQPAPSTALYLPVMSEYCVLLVCGGQQAHFPSSPCKLLRLNSLPSPNLQQPDLWRDKLSPLFFQHSYRASAAYVQSNDLSPHAGPSDVRPWEPRAWEPVVE